MKNNLYIISNESISLENNIYRCDNIDIKSIPESLQLSGFNVFLLARKSKVKRTKSINLKNIKIFSNIFFYIFELLKSIKNKNNNYLVVSITPYTFLAIIFLKLFREKPFVYLRSDGFKEYKAILGLCGSLIYYFMFNIVARLSFLIACREHLLIKKKGKIVHPSQLNEKWFINQSAKIEKHNNLLYVGRIRIEKGIFSLIKILENSNLNLTIVSPEIVNKIPEMPKNVSIINFENNNDEIIKCYDSYSMFILPSFTEAHPQVLDEALSRHKPVIIFEEISHVARDRKGIFISKRNITSLEETFNYIINNYVNIQIEIKKNILPTKKQFIEELRDILIKK